MDFNNTVDGLILLICGVLIALYGRGIWPISLRQSSPLPAATARNVLWIGVLLALAGFISLLLGLR